MLFGVFFFKPRNISVISVRFSVYLSSKLIWQATTQGGGEEHGPVIMAQLKSPLESVSTPTSKHNFVETDVREIQLIA